jgi:hypothetical protein
MSGRLIDNDREFLGAVNQHPPANDQAAEWGTASLDPFPRLSSIRRRFRISPAQ